MAVTINGEKRRMGLALSGGGFRAAAFHLGVMRKLQNRLDKLAKTYDRDLFHGAKLSALRSGPQRYINATNLSTGNMFFFVAGGAGPEEMGEHELGVVASADFSLAKAVAASSAFPPVFPPLRIEAPGYVPATQVDYVTLTDGGVYDNMGGTKSSTGATWRCLGRCPHPCICARTASSQ